MIEQISTSVKFVAFYTANKTGTTGLTVTVDVYSPAGSQIVTAAAAKRLRHRDDVELRSDKITVFPIPKWKHQRL